MANAYLLLESGGKGTSTAGKYKWTVRREAKGVPQDISSPSLIFTCILEALGISRDVTTL